MLKRESYELRIRERLLAWRDGESPLAAIELMVEAGQEEQARALARCVLESPGCPDADRIREILNGLERFPPGWERTLDDLAANPTIDKWEALVRFVSLDAQYDWCRCAIRKLRERACDPVMLFRFASTGGTLPDAIGFVEAGLVPPEIIVERANEPGAATSVWLGLAAQAAFLRGDRVNTVRYLREAFAAETELSTPELSLLWIEERADDELREVLGSIRE